MNIEIVSIGDKFVKTPKGGYNKMTVTFDNLTYNKQGETKTIMGFGAQEPAYKALKDAKSGDVFQVEVVKNEKGYNDWVAVHGDTDSPVSSVADSGTPRSAAQSGPAYNIKDRDAARQLSIVRQSSLKAAIEFLNHTQKSYPLEDAFETAEKIRDFIDNGIPSEDAPAVDSVDDIEDDIPF